MQPLEWLKSKTLTIPTFGKVVKYLELVYYYWWDYKSLGTFEIV